MSSGLQLSPADLDRLEDALEDLDELGPPSMVDGDPVAQRLGEFHELLQLSRQALPLEEVPAGVLDGVMAQARAAATTASPVTTGSWWSRWRLRVWVPAVAFAGSAALLLVMLWPGDRADGPSETRGDMVARAETPAPLEAAAKDQPERAVAGKLGRLADASGDRIAADGDDGIQRGQGVAIGNRGPAEPSVVTRSLADDDEEAEAPAFAEQERKVDTERQRRSKPQPKPKPSAPGRGGGAAPTNSGAKGSGSDPSPPPKSSAPKKTDDAPPSRKDEPASLWSEVLEGDNLRHSGNCGLAAMRYTKARKSDDKHVRARALAGQGLCEAAAGRSEAASKLLAQARAADPSVAGYIEGQLDALDGAPSSNPPNAAAEQRVQTDEQAAE